MSLNIPLFDNYRIKSDVRNVMLVRIEEDREFIEGFYSDIGNCLSAFIDKRIKGFDSTGIAELIQSIKILQTALNKAIQPLKLVVVSVSELPKGTAD